MNKKWMFLLVFAAVSASAGEFSGRAEGSLWLEGDSTLHVFSSTATAVFAAGRLDSFSGAMAGDGSASLTLTIPVEGLKSGKGGLDKNLYKALRAESYPEIVFTLSSLAPGGPAVWTAEGVLSVAGEDRPVLLSVALDEEAGSVRVTGEHRLKMSDFGVKPPVMMMGAIKTRDDIRIRFDLRLPSEGER